VSVSRRRRRVVIVATGAVGLLALGLLVARWTELRSRWVLWRAFERVGTTDSGLGIFRHRASGLRMVRLPGGAYHQGASEGEPGAFEHELPRRLVRVSPFLIAEREVSQVEWRRLAGEHFFLHRGDDLPAHGVSWLECAKLCEEVGLSLPTEAEWEYACRGGTDTAFWPGQRLAPGAARSGRLPSSGGGSSPLDGVDAGEPNPFGLYAVHGNVEEWCLDAFDPDFYERDPGDVPVDPVCLDGADSKVVRGGSFLSTVEECRSARRGALPFSSATSSVGLRPVYRLALDDEPRIFATTRGP